MSAVDAILASIESYHSSQHYLKPIAEGEVLPPCEAVCAIPSGMRAGTWRFNGFTTGFASWSRDLHLVAKPSSTRPWGHATPIIDEWILATALRWEEALSVTPPRFDEVEDMPDAPGDVSVDDLIEALRAKAETG